MGTNYYISDLHFGHENIIRHCHRPFASAEEMNHVIIDNWNSVVGRNDEVYILGDIGHTSCDLCRILDELNGRKHLVIGNHDKKPLRNREFRKRFVEIHNTITVRDNGVEIFLFHYPVVEWDGFYRGGWHFYGHIHNNKNAAYELMKNVPRAVNAGADCIGFTPRTAKELMENYNDRD